jgi:ParB family chromosome partitioning protein
MEKKALGRGLEALLPEAPVRATAATVATEEIHQVPTDRIISNPFQPRQQFREDDNIQLAESIKRNGLIQPILVRSKGDGAFELIAGERRLRAARLAGLRTVPAIIRHSTDEQSMQIALVENLQRKDLNPMEEARGYHRMIKDFAYTQETLAQRIGKDRSTVANILRLVQLPPDVQSLVESGALSLGHAKVILGLSHADQQLHLAHHIVRDQLSVREAEKWTTDVARKGKRKRPIHTPGPYGDLEERLRKRFATRVAITKNRRRGRIVIEYYSAQELERLVEVLLGQ